MTGTLSRDTVAIIQATVPALEAHGVAITAAMYRRLFENAEITALFNDSHRADGSQVRALATAIIAYARHIEHPDALRSALDRIAARHVGYAIRPAHYPYVATALLDAIGEVLGDAATAEILAAWGEAYWFLAGLLQEHEGLLRGGIVAAPGGWDGWRRFVISGRQAESETITSFILKPEDGGAVLAHRAGQYLTARFDAAGHAGWRRNYSISCGPNNDHYRITVRRGDGASAFLHESAGIGTILEATPPVGDFHLVEPPSRPVVLLSGGVGLTPLVSMMERLAEAYPETPVRYVHGTTSRATHAFEAHIGKLAQRLDDAVATTFYEHAESGSAAQSGFVTLEWLRANLPLQDADIYLCGPRAFLRVFVAGLAAAGVSPERLHYEFFGPTDEILTA